jgi:hypothetical protein
MDLNLNYIKMKYAVCYLVLFALFFSIGCQPFLDPNEKPDYDKRIIIKTIQLNRDTMIELYHYSLITGYSPCFVDYKTKKSHKLICKSSYVSDVNLIADTLKIVFWENRNFGLDTADMHGLKIVLDTTGYQPSW